MTLRRHDANVAEGHNISLQIWQIACSIGCDGVIIARDANARFSHKKHSSATCTSDRPNTCDGGASKWPGIARSEDVCTCHPALVASKHMPSLACSKIQRADLPTSQTQYFAKLSACLGHSGYCLCVVMALSITKVLSNVRACNVHDLESSAVVFDAHTKMFLKRRRSNETTLGKKLPPLARTVGLCLYATQDFITRVVSIHSLYTNECVAKINAKTNRFVIGVHAFAFACAGGVKACQLSAPDQLCWVHRSTRPLRIAMFPETDDLVVVECHQSAPTAVVVKLDTFNFQSQTSHAGSTRHIPEPLIMGPLLCMNRHDVHFVIVLDGKSMACVCNTNSAMPSGMINLGLAKCTSPSHKTEAPKSYAAVLTNAVISITSNTDENGITQFLLCKTAPPKTTTLALPGASSLVIRDDVVCVWTENGNVYALGDAVDTFATTRVLPTMVLHAKKMHSICTRCRQPKCSSHDHMSLCAQCTTPNTVLFAFGKACRYLRYKYGYIMSPQEAQHLKAVFLAAPTCAHSAKSHKTNKLVFVTTQKDKTLTDIQHTVLVAFQHRHKRITKFIRAIAIQRWQKHLMNGN